MVVFVCCAGGATSSLFCQKIKEAQGKDDKIYFGDIHDVIKELEAGNLNDYNIILGYGAVDKVSNRFIEELNFKDMVDFIWIAPQARYHVNRIKPLVEPFGIKCESIDMMTFGRMNGKKAIDDLKKIIHK